MQPAVVIIDACSVCAEHIKERRNSSEVWITALLLLCTFALYVTLQEEQKDNEFNKKYP